ncbi:hypothetical protein H4R34_004126, partial [Dimargaris verticillata]
PPKRQVDPNEPAWLPNPSPRAIPRLSQSLRPTPTGNSQATVAPHTNVLTTTLQVLMPSLTPDPAIDVTSYQRTTAQELATSKRPPRNKQMLVRDYVDDSLYNPHYGYFSQHAAIYTPPEPVDLTQVHDSLEFMNLVADRYREIEQGVDADASAAANRPPAKQVWHTPTELFNPWFGQAIAKYIVTEYKLNHYPEDDLVIYELGAGNGTLMLNIMDYLQQHEPIVYARTQYRVIEISTQLSERQADNQASRNFTAIHRGIQVINRSIFDWNTVVPNPCFFIAMEVIDNFAHDLVRYDPLTEKPYQGTVLTDRHGDFTEAFEPLTDPLIQRYLRLRQQVGYQTPLLRPTAKLWHRVRQRLPFPPNLTEPEFIPTRSLQLLDTLGKYFPRHRLVLSDFYSLPEAVPGIDGPVVQTRYKHTMVPCSTYMVQPGWFDIFFPTNFELLRDIYRTVCQPYFSRGQAKVLTQRDFLERYGDVENTTTRSGENPLLEYYENNKFLLS